MVEFTLPQNSKIVEGKTFKKKNISSNHKVIEIYRWERDSGEKPRIDKFYIELDKAVDLCYRPQAFKNESNRIEFLFELYEQYTLP